jgi:hypothetical protein
MKTFLCVIAIATLTVIPAYARIGETFDELVTRFGQPNKPLTTSVGVEDWIFKFKDWVISVRLVNGRSAWESYHIANGVRKFSQNDIELILGANSRGKQWKPVTEIDEAGMHERLPEDGWAEARDGRRYFVRAWKLEGDTLTAIQIEDTLKVISKEWNDYESAFFEKLKQKTDKERAKAVKDSGL